MTGRVLLTLAVVIALTGCARVSNSRLNPLNWFGRSERVETVVAVPGQGLPALNLVSQITQLRVEASPGGAIIRATGLPPQQGFYDGELVLLGSENGVLSYQFAIKPPLSQTRVGPQQSREIVVGLFVSNQRLEGIRQISVSAAGNALGVKR